MHAVTTATVMTAFAFKLATHNAPPPLLVR